MPRRKLFSTCTRIDLFLSYGDEFRFIAGHGPGSGLPGSAFNGRSIRPACRHRPAGPAGGLALTILTMLTLIWPLRKSV